MLAKLPRQVGRIAELLGHQDWLVLLGTTDRFEPNHLKGDVTLRRGDRVYLAGYPMARPTASSETLIRHMQREPFVTMGRVISPSLSRTGPGLVDVVIPRPEGDGHGFSGGPAVVLDERGEIRVWGVVVRKAWRWSVWPVLHRQFVLRVARLSQAEVEQFECVRLLGPEEIEGRTTTTKPSVE